MTTEQATVTAPTLEQIEAARVAVVRLGEAIDASSRAMHTLSSSGSPQLRARLESRYVVALAHLDALLAAEDAAASQAKAKAQAAP